MTSIPASRSARAITLAPRSCPSSPGLATTTRTGPAATPITASMKRLHPSVPTSTEHAMYVTATAPIRHGRPHTTLCEEVNERNLHHPATGSFAVQTEGEITRWDTLAAHRSESLR